MQLMKNETGQDTPAKTQRDTDYLMIVGVLLLTIVVTLGVLWQKERRRRINAELKLRDLRKSVILEQLQKGQAKFLQGLLPQGLGGETARPVQREDLVSETTTIKGRPVRVMYISAAAGRRFGFKTGDVVIVGTLPTTRPAGGKLP